MTYDIQEKSEFGGKPVELFKFANSDYAFRYSSTEATTYLAEDYKALEITRRNIGQSSTLDRADLILTVPSDCALVKEYIRRIPPTPYWLNIFRFHYGDAEVKQFWQGRVLTVTPQGLTADVRLESVITAQGRQGLQREYQNLCNNFLYDGKGCPVNKALHTRAATVSAISGDTLTVTGLSSYINEWFEGGYVELADGDQRDVLKWVQSTGVLTLTHNFPSSSIQVSDPITVYDGCKHRFVEDCTSKFGTETNNGESFGGFPYHGSRNPFKAGVN